MSSVKIACQAAENVPLEKVLDFQGDLKDLGTNEYHKIRKSIVDNGITFPLFVWKHEGSYYNIDGHQRTKVLRDLKSEGWIVPDLPVALIDAKNEKEAKKKILLASSSYANVTSEGLTDFLNKAGLPLDEVEDILKLPDFDLNAFRKGFYSESGEGSGSESAGANPEDSDIENMELMPNEHHDYIVLLFDDASDFMYACDKLGIKKVNHSTVNDVKRVGIGRCLSGRKFIGTLEEMSKPIEPVKPKKNESGKRK